MTDNKRQKIPYIRVGLRGFNKFYGKRDWYSIDEFFKNIRNLSLIIPTFTHSKPLDNLSKDFEVLSFNGYLDIDLDVGNDIMNGKVSLFSDEPARKYNDAKECKLYFNAKVKKCKSLGGICECCPLFKEVFELTLKICNCLKSASISYLCFFTGGRGFRILLKDKDLWVKVKYHDSYGESILKNLIIPYFKKIGVNDIKNDDFDKNVFDKDKGIKTDLLPHATTGCYAVSIIESDEIMNMSLISLNEDPELSNNIIEFWKYVFDTLPSNAPQLKIITSSNEKKKGKGKSKNSTHFVLKHHAEFKSIQNLDEFYKKLNDDYNNRIPIYWHEIFTEISRFVLDIDGYPGDIGIELIPLIQRLFIQAGLKVDNCFLWQRPQTILGKYGHIIWPDFFVTKKQGKKLTLWLIDELYKEIPDINWKKVIDPNTFKRCTLSIPGSDKHPSFGIGNRLELKGIYDITGKIIEESITYLNALKCCSLRNPGNWSIPKALPPSIKNIVSNKGDGDWIYDKKIPQDDEKFIEENFGSFFDDYVYDEKNNKFYITLKNQECIRIKRKHKKQHVKLIYDPLARSVQISCHDEECKADKNFDWPITFLSDANVNSVPIPNDTPVDIPDEVPFNVSDDTPANIFEENSIDNFLFNYLIKEFENIRKGSMKLKKQLNTYFVMAQCIKHLKEIKIHVLMEGKIKILIGCDECNINDEKILPPVLLLALWPKIKYIAFDGTTHFRVLNITSISNFNDISQAYKEKALLWHPDKVSPLKNLVSIEIYEKWKPLFNLRFKRIFNAWEVLRNSIKKSNYEKFELPKIEALLIQYSSWYKVDNPSLYHCLELLDLFSPHDCTDHIKRKIKNLLELSIDRWSMDTRKIAIKYIFKYNRNVVGMLDIKYISGNNSTEKMIWKTYNRQRGRVDNGIVDISTHFVYYNMTFNNKFDPDLSFDEEECLIKNDRLMLDEVRRNIVELFMEPILENNDLIKKRYHLIKKNLLFLTLEDCAYIDPDLIYYDLESDEFIYPLEISCMKQQDKAQRSDPNKFDRSLIMKLFTVKGSWCSRCNCCNQGENVNLDDHLGVVNVVNGFKVTSEKVVEINGKIWREREFYGIKLSKSLIEIMKKNLKGKIYQIKEYQKSREFYMASNDTGRFSKFSMIQMISELDKIMNPFVESFGISLSDSKRRELLNISVKWLDPNYLDYTNKYLPLKDGLLCLNDWLNKKQLKIIDYNDVEDNYIFSEKYFFQFNRDELENLTRGNNSIEKEAEYCVETFFKHVFTYDHDAMEVNTKNLTRWDDDKDKEFDEIAMNYYFMLHGGAHLRDHYHGKVILALIGPSDTGKGVSKELWKKVESEKMWHDFDLSAATSHFEQSFTAEARKLNLDDWNKLTKGQNPNEVFKFYMNSCDKEISDKTTKHGDPKKVNKCALVTHLLNNDKFFNKCPEEYLVGLKSRVKTIFFSNHVSKEMGKNVSNDPKMALSMFCKMLLSMRDYKEQKYDESKRMKISKAMIFFRERTYLRFLMCCGEEVEGSIVKSEDLLNYFNNFKKSVFENSNEEWDRKYFYNNLKNVIEILPDKNSIKISIYTPDKSIWNRGSFELINYELN